MPHGFTTRCFITTQQVDAVQHNTAQNAKVVRCNSCRYLARGATFEEEDEDPDDLPGTPPE